MPARPLTRNPHDRAPPQCRDAAVILLALCREPEKIVPNWKIVDMTWNAYIREFGVQDPDGHDIAFGQPLR